MKFKDIGEALEKLQKSFIGKDILATVYVTKDGAEILSLEQAQVKKEETTPPPLPNLSNA